MLSSANFWSILILPFGFTFLAARPKKSLGSTSFKTSLSLTSDFLGGLEVPGFVAKSSSTNISKWVFLLLDYKVN